MSAIRKLFGWQRAVLVILGLVNLWSCYVVRHEHPVWAVAHALAAGVLFTLLAITWPANGNGK